MLSVSPGVEVDAAHFLEAEVGAEGRGGRPVRLEDSGFQAHGAGISQPYIYALFPNKKALFIAVHERVSQRIRDTRSWTAMKSAFLLGNSA